jgi:hypothetical protein
MTKQTKGSAKGASKLDRQVRRIVARLAKLDKHDAKAIAHNKKVAKKGTPQTKGRAKVALSRDKIVASAVNEIQKNIRREASKKATQDNQKKGRARQPRKGGYADTLQKAAGAKRKKTDAAKARHRRFGMTDPKE